MAAKSTKYRPLAGIAWLLGGFVLLVLSDATAKWLVESHSVMQVVCLRAFIKVCGLAMFLGLSGRSEVMHPGDLNMQLTRGSLACWQSSVPCVTW